MTKYFVKFHTKKYDRWAESYDYKHHEAIATLLLVNDVKGIYKAIEEKTGIYPDGIDFMVAVP